MTDTYVTLYHLPRAKDITIGSLVCIGLMYLVVDDIDEDAGMFTGLDDDGGSHEHYIHSIDAVMD